MISSFASVEKSSKSVSSSDVKKTKVTKRALKRKSKQDALDAEEHQLESLLFGRSVGKIGSIIQDDMVSGEEMEEMPFGEIIDDNDRDRASNTSDVYGEESDEMLEDHSDGEEFDEHGIMIDRSQLSSNKSKKKDSESSGTKTTKKDSSTGGIARMIDRTLNTTSEYDEAIVPAVWVDPDEDEDFDTTKDNISLVATQRLKKFRTSLDQKAINTQDYARQLRSHHEYSTSVPTSWAKLEPRHTQTRKSNDDDEIDQAMSTSAYQLLSSSATPLTLLGTGGFSSSNAALPAQSIRLERQPDANLMEPNNAAVQSVKFHPQQSNILFTAGLDKTLRFFQIDGKTNPKVHGIYFPNMPIMSASYLGPQGREIVLSGRRSFFYICDIASGKVTNIPRILHRSEKSLERMITSPCGKSIVFVGNDGHAILVDSLSRQLSSTIKMNGSCRAVSYSPCGTYLFSSGSDGDVYQWDVRKHSGSIPNCVRRISNEDGTITQSLALSDQLLAVGAESGVVNLFPNPCVARHDFSSEEKMSLSSSRAMKPLKRLMNLHTCASGLKFNHDGQILAMWSRFENGLGSLKLVHCQSQTVFANWPTSKTPLGYVWSLDFSPTGEYMAVGNDKGKCLLYSVRHYSDSN